MSPKKWPKIVLPKFLPDLPILGQIRTKYVLFQISKKYFYKREIITRVQSGKLAVWKRGARWIKDGVHTTQYICDGVQWDGVKSGLQGYSEMGDKGTKPGSTRVVPGYQG